MKKAKKEEKEKKKSENIKKRRNAEKSCSKDWARENYWIVGQQSWL